MNMGDNFMPRKKRLFVNVDSFNDNEFSINKVHSPPCKGTCRMLKNWCHQ